MQSGSQQSATKPSGPALRLLQKMASLYGRGDLGGAEEACRQLLQLDPAQADALHVLGLVAWRRGEREPALAEIRKAIASDPRKPQPHNSLGVILKDLGDLAGAEAAVRTAIDLMPSYPEALTNLGNILCETGRIADAEATHRRVVELVPQYADGHNNLATVLARQERWDEAVVECRGAVALQPTRAEFQLNLGNALSALKEWQDAAQAFRRATDLTPGNADAHANLGIALFHLDQFEQATAAHRAATELRPDSAHIWANLGAAQADLGDSDAALDSCRKALALDPSLPEVYNSMGMAFRAKGMQGNALAAFQTAIRLRADYYKAYSNMGTVLYAQGRFSEASAAYERALALMPSFAEAQWNRGMLHLLFGEFEAGWRGHEQGLGMKRGRAQVRRDSFRRWDGAAIAGKTILVSGEQGVGDQIMFASLLPDLVERGAKVLADVERRLHPLLQRSFPGVALVPDDDGVASPIGELAIDYQAPIGSLCRWLRPDAKSFPKRQGYLRPDAAQTSSLRRRYRQRFGDRPLVGISWRGGTQEVAAVRSTALTAWAPILKQRAFGFVNLQYGDCRADLDAVKREMGVEILHDESVDPLRDLDGFAAQTAAMDLVISVDNTTVHMAGALNVPVWTLLAVVPDWRWMLGRSDSPWYSSVRLFRQARAGEWSSVIDEVAEELRRAFGTANQDGAAGDRPSPGAPSS